MRVAWALINIPTPEVLHARLGARSRSVVSAGSVMTAMTGFRKFARWLDAQGVARLTDVDQEMLEKYAAYLGEKGFTDGHDERQLFALTRVWAYAPHLLPEDRLVMPPWEDPGAAIIDFLGDDFSRERGENREVVIHPATMSPLLVWALRMVLSRHFKGVTDADGNTLPRGEIRPEPWTVIELVDRAVKVLEQLHDDRLLFPRSLTVRTLQPTQAEIRAEGLSPNRFTGRIKAFIDWANATATRLDRTHELIPADPHGPITLRRLRRTVARFIYRRPGGRIALGLQYGHVGTSLAESYGGRTKADMLEILDFERALALADALAEASDRLSAGEKGQRASC